MTEKMRTKEDLDVCSKPHFVYWCQDPGELNRSTEGYAGITHDLIDRETQHRKPGGKLTYPESKFHEIGRGTLKQCRQMEYLLRPTARIGRNINPGGAWSGFIRLTPEEKAKSNLKASATLTGKKHTPETIAKMSEAATGKKHTPETIAKMSESRRGRKRSPETCAKISEAGRGRKHTPEVYARGWETRRRNKLSREEQS